MHAVKSITADELLEMGDIGRCELIRGEIVKMAPAGMYHGDISSAIVFRIMHFVKPLRLGKVHGPDTGFIIGRDPDTVRSPDVAFIAAHRVTIKNQAGYFNGPPDLAVEVISPTDRKSEVVDKVGQWLSAGTKSVWVVDPPTRTVEIYRPNVAPVRYQISDQIEDEPTLPGFVLPVADIFDAD